MLWLTKKHIPMIVLLFIAVLFFGWKFLFPLNYEFLIYIAVIFFFFFVILQINKSYKFPNFVLWLLTIWAILHMAWGGIIIGDHVLYQQILIPIMNDWEWQILRFDQFIHAFWFFTATIFSYFLLKPQLKNPQIGTSLSILLIMIWIWFWALNEVIEFIVDTALPESGVGGYINTGMDLVANFIGSILGLIFLKKEFDK